MEVNMMKRVDIIYGQSLKGIEGINYVNSAFVEGNKYFKKNGIILSKIYSPYEIFDCINQNRLTLIGSDMHLSSYERKRKVRMFLRKIFSSDYLPGASLKFYLNYIITSQKSVHNYLRAKSESDFIIFQSFLSAYFYFKYSKNKNKKTILILHCSKDPFEQMAPNFKGLFSHRWFKKWIYGRLNFVFYKIDKIVYLSKRAVEYSSASKDKKTYIYNGEEDLKEWIPTDVHEPLNLVCVGSMNWRKGQDLVIEALSRLSRVKRDKIKFHLVGDGPQMAELKNAVIANNLQNIVAFYGARNDVASFLREMDVFIMPSKTEGLPMSIIEVLRQGMYVMSTDTGAIPEMVKEDFGKIIDRNPDSIAKILEELVDKKIINIELKKQAREHYLNHFTLHSMIDGYSNLLNSLG